MSHPITDTVLKNAFDYPQYRHLMDQLVAEEKTTGTNQSEDMVAYTKQNLHRIKRVEKTVKINDELTTALQAIQTPWTWLVLVEAWCGDVPANVPVIAKMAEISPNISLKLILRDENLDIMDAFLTNGYSRAIPKMICLHSDTLEVIGTWGPRPAPAQKMVMDNKDNPVEPYAEFVKKVQLWYAKDKGKTIQAEFLELVNEWQDL